MAIFVGLMHHRLSNDDESSEHINENEEFYLNSGVEYIPSIQVN